MIRGRYVAGKSNTVCPMLKTFFNKNTQLLHGTVPGTVAAGLRGGWSKKKWEKFIGSSLVCYL